MSVTCRVASGLAFLPLVIIAIGCQDEKPTNIYHAEDNPAYVQDIWPIWSPADSTLIAYTHIAVTGGEYMELGERSVWTVNIGTLETRHIAPGVVRDWSPDGQRLMIWQKGKGWLLLDMDGGDEELLPIRGYSPDFSPCGTKIAFDSSEDPIGATIHNLETQETRWVCSQGEPDWSPDGSKLLCFIMDVYDTAGTFLGTIPYDQQYGYGWHARWSPDGDRVTYGAYCTSTKESVGIWVINPDGTDQQLAICHGAVPSWSPDSKRIAYGGPSADGRAMVLWVVNADGTDPQQITFPYRP